MEPLKLQDHAINLY